jgi:hypothetical protein
MPEALRLHPHNHSPIKKEEPFTTEGLMTLENFRSFFAPLSVETHLIYEKRKGTGSLYARHSCSHIHCLYVGDVRRHCAGLRCGWNSQMDMETDHQENPAATS